MLCRLRGWRCLIRMRRMAELTPLLRAPVVGNADLAINQKSSSGHLNDVSGGDGLRHRKSAWIALRKCEVVCQCALQTECAAHQRKRIRGHVCVNVWAETGQNAVIKRLLKWRHPVPHLHLDQDRD